MTDADFAVAVRDLTRRVAALEHKETVAPGSGAFRYKLGSSTAVSATSVTLNTAYPNAVAYQTYMLIDPFTPECESRLITGISGLTYSVDALEYAHDENDAIWFTELPLLSVMWFGAKALDTFDNNTAVTRAIVQADTPGWGAGFVTTPSGSFGMLSPFEVPKGVTFQCAGVADVGTEFVAMAGWSGSYMAKLGQSDENSAGVWLRDVRLNCNNLVNYGIWSDRLDEPSGAERVWVVDA